MKKIKLTQENLNKYHSQTNVIQDKNRDCNLNYGTIKIMTDADHDGNDIQCLLIQFFSHWPQLFLQNRIKRLNSPLFVARKKNSETKYYFTFDELEEAKSKNELGGYSIEYMKGLGSLTDEDYSIVINEPRDTLINYDAKSVESLEMAFGRDSQLRKDWLLIE